MLKASFELISLGSKYALSAVPFNLSYCVPPFFLHYFSALTSLLFLYSKACPTAIDTNCTNLGQKGPFGPCREKQWWPKGESDQQLVVFHLKIKSIKQRVG